MHACCCAYLEVLDADMIHLCAALQAVGPAASKTGDMLQGPPTPRFYEAVTVTEQTLF